MNMKNLTECLNESILDDLKNGVRSILAKIFSSNQINKRHKFLSEFILDNAATINKFFDITDQRETGYELAEYGVLDRIEDIVEMLDVIRNIQIKPQDLKDVIKKSKVFKLSDVDDNFVWYMPAFDILAIDFEDINEEECIKSYKDFYKKK